MVIVRAMVVLACCGVDSDDGVVMTVAMKLRDEGEDGDQLR